jgi:hypothetical protein
MLMFGYLFYVLTWTHPHSGNEFWTVLAADKRTVAVQPFKITQNNQWISIQPSA